MHTLFTMILGGLVGATPHMVSASVMALARLLYEFAPLLESAAPQLLPVVLSLLRSKSREIIKSVLGFIKVNLWKVQLEHVERQLSMERGLGRPVLQVSLQSIGAGSPSTVQPDVCVGEL